MVTEEDDYGDQRSPTRVTDQGHKAEVTERRSRRCTQRTTLEEKDRKEKNAPGTPGEDTSAAGEPGELSQSGEERR